MSLDAELVYPNCPMVIRTVTIGGLTKAELLEQLHAQAISLNESAQRLFDNALFSTAPTCSSVTTVELTVQDLGFPQGAKIAEIQARAKTLGLGLCPLELAPQLRLQYLDQPEGYWGQPVRPHQAPSGSITIVSEELTPEEDVPKGFYLRRIKGELWLRGYRSWAGHVWNAEDHLLFCQP